MPINGLQSILSALTTLSQGLEGQVQTELEIAGENCLADAEAAAPVDTGALAASGSIEKEHLKVTITFDTEPLTGKDYALPVEMGHMSRAGTPVPPQHFLLPAFYDWQAELLDNLENL